MAATVTSLGTASTLNALATITTTADAPVGSYIVVFGGGNLNGALAFTITDSAGNTYATQTESATSSAPIQRINAAVCEVGTLLSAGSTITCNIATGARGNQTFCAAVITGATATALDASPVPTVSSASGTTATWPPTGVLTQADELLLAFVMAGANTASISSMTGWTEVNSVTSAARTGSLRYKVVSSTASTTPSATLSTSTSWAANLVSLKLVTAPVGTTGSYGDPLQRSLNRLAGTTGMDAQGAANVWAGTTGLDLLGALNAKNGTTGLGLNAVLNDLANTTNLDADGAAVQILA